MGTRLNKFLALCGLGSRRKVEGLIISGKININGKIVKKLHTIVEPADIVKANGKTIKPRDKFHYIVLNKPKGYITTTSDEKGRPTVMDIIPEKYKRAGIYPVGRLDKNTEGLLLFTNDGLLAGKLTRPDSNVKKEYIVEINKPLDITDKQKIEKGIYIHQIKIKTKPACIDIIDKSDMLVKIVIVEGKNRQLRYTFSNLGYKIRMLKRTSYGTITIKGINKGTHRVLNQKEIKSLKKLIGAGLIPD